MAEDSSGKPLVPQAQSRLTEYAARRRAADLEGHRFLIQTGPIIRYFNQVATGKRVITRRTRVRLYAGEVLLRKVLPDISQVDFRGLFGFAPLSARSEQLAKLTPQQLEQMIAFAEMMKGVVSAPATIEGQATVVPEPPQTRAENRKSKGNGQRRGNGKQGNGHG